MVLLAAGISTKSGKALVSRQFVEMTRARIEGLLAAFPKLLGSEKGGARQHTFVETESVRYVYQPMDQLYVVLITTKASNILEDLETLRLFSRVIPEYCRTMDEKEILDQSFQLIFAFDEIVALGYRENVNLAQIRTFTEMDSHEERVFYQIKKTQEEEAKKMARDRAKEINKQRQEQQKRGGRPMTSMGGMGSGGGRYDPTPTEDPVPAKPSYNPPPSRPTGGSGKGWKLGSKKVDEDSFITQLKSEGQDIVSPTKGGPRTIGGAAAPAQVTGAHTESVHLRTEEKIMMSMTRDGGLESLEVHGLLTLRVTDPQFDKVRVKINNKDNKGAQLQTHPNLDKKNFQANSMLALKNPQAKPFPANTDVGVLKWRFQSSDEAFVPLSINCWPSESGRGCEVNIEYTLDMDDLELHDVSITIPLPSGAVPTIGECDGEYRHEKSRNLLEWRIPLIDSSNKNGTMDFTTNMGHSDNFFPVKINFQSKKLFCDITPAGVLALDADTAVPYSEEATFFTERYEIV